MWVLHCPLHLHQERLELLSHRAVEQVLGLVYNFFWNSLSNQKLACLISEIVAIMVNEMVLFRGIFVSNIIQEVFEYLFGKFSCTHVHFFNRFSVGSFFWMIMTNSASEIILFAIDNERWVVNGVDLLAYHHHAKALGHSLSYIVKCEGNFLSHFKKFLKLYEFNSYNICILILICLSHFFF